ncbi:MAG: hypothetical protein IPN17_31085 [Deltaproteobacteria bacterium]|nr:hypothetical protein [Deltaproteobacteria bacterium]
MYHAALALLTVACGAAPRDPQTLTVLSLNRPEHIDPRHPRRRLRQRALAPGLLVAARLRPADLSPEALPRPLAAVGGTDPAVLEPGVTRAFTTAPVRGEDVAETFRSVMDARGGAACGRPTPG